MTDTRDHPGGKKSTQQQAAEVGGDDKTGEVGGKTFHLRAHPEQGRKQPVGEQQQPIAEQYRANGKQGLEQERSDSGAYPAEFDTLNQTMLDIILPSENGLHSHQTQALTIEHAAINLCFVPGGPGASEITHAVYSTRVAIKPRFIDDNYYKTDCYYKPEELT